MNHLLALGTLLVAAGGDLPRQADLRFRVTSADRVLVVRSVQPDSPAAHAGLSTDDRILAVDGRPYRQPYEGRDLLRRLDGDRAVTLTIQRGQRTETVRFTPAAKAPETIDGFTTETGVHVTRDGARLRTYVSVPVAGASGENGVKRRWPALFFVQWVACGTIEVTPGDPTTDMMVAVARRTGRVLVRVERSSNGDSEGPACHALDFDTEVAHYRSAFEALATHPRIDRRRIVVWGSSLGSVVAPFVVRGWPIAGLAVGGGGALTYLERMLTFDRIRLERDGVDPETFRAEMYRRHRFHYAYLVEGRRPDAIERADPNLAGVWKRIFGTGDGVHYGRPFAYHQQAAKKDILSAWLDVSVPVLVMYNAFDQFEAEYGHRLIARTLNRRRPGQATYVRHEKMGHSYRLYPDEYAAHRWDRATRVSGAHIGAKTLGDWILSRTP